MKEQQNCILCNGIRNRKRNEIEYTAAGNYSCSALLSELDYIYSQNMTSLDKCEALKNECITCDGEIIIATTNDNNNNDNNNMYMDFTITDSRVEFGAKVQKLVEDDKLVQDDLSN